jgi:hypothetical protein
MGMHVDKSGEDIATGRIDGLDLSVGVFDTFFIGSHLWPFALLTRHSYLPYLSLFDKEISCAVNALRRIDDAAVLNYDIHFSPSREAGVPESLVSRYYRRSKTTFVLHTKIRAEGKAQANDVLRISSHVQGLWGMPGS